MDAPVNPVPYPIAATSSSISWTITADSQQLTLAQISVTLSADGTPTAPDSWSLSKPALSSASIVGSGHTVTATPDEPGTYVLRATVDGAEVAKSVVRVGDDDGWIYVDFTAATIVNAGMWHASTSWGVDDSTVVVAATHGNLDASLDCGFALVNIGAVKGRQLHLVCFALVGPTEDPGVSYAGIPIVAMPSSTPASGEGYYGGLYRTALPVNMGITPNRIGSANTPSGNTLGDAPLEATLAVDFTGTTAVAASSSQWGASSDNNEQIATDSSGSWSACWVGLAGIQNDGAPGSVVTWDEVYLKWRWVR